MAVPRGTQTGSTAPDAPTTGAETASPSTQEPASQPETVDFIRDWFRPRVEQPAQAIEQAKADNGESDGTGTENGKGADLPPGARIITQDEIDRLVQGETDRRERKRREDEQRRSEKELRDKDPYKYAQMQAQREREEEEKRAKTVETTQVVNARLKEYDNNILDPLFLAIPTDMHPALVEEINKHPDGVIVGRGVAAKKIIDMIAQQGREKGLNDARRTLIEDETFVKEILARRGGQRIEPEVVSAVGAAQRRGSADGEWNDFIRGGRRGFPG